MGKKGALSQFARVHVCVTEVAGSDLPGWPVCAVADQSPTWHSRAVSVAHWSCPHLGWLAGWQPLIRSQRGKSQLPVPKASWEVNLPAQTVFNLWRLDEVSHLACRGCVLPAACSPDLLSAGALTWGRIEKDRRGKEGRCSWDGGAGYAATALFCPSSCWPWAGSCCCLLPYPQAPQMEGGKINSPCISCQGCVVD